MQQLTEQPTGLSLGPSALSEALEAFAADMRRRDCEEGSIKQFVRHVKLAAAAGRWASPAEMTFAAAAAHLAGAKDSRGWSPSTCNSAVTALRSFSRFCAASQLIERDPFLMLAGSAEEGGPGGRPMKVEEVRAMMRVSAVAVANDGRARCPRPLFYGLLCLTGLRHHEAAECTWGDVDLESECPAIWTSPVWSKNSKRQRVVLCSQLVEELREWKERVPCGRTAPVFPHAVNKKTWQKDRQAAGVPEMDARGRPCGLHSCRRALATWLYEAGVTDAVISRIMRHAASLTQAVYIDPSPELERAAVEKLPLLFISGDGEPAYLPMRPNLTGAVSLRQREGCPKKSRVGLAAPGELADTPNARNSTNDDNRKSASVPHGIPRKMSPQGSGSGLSHAVGGPGPSDPAVRRDLSPDEAPAQLDSQTVRFGAPTAPDLILRYAEQVERLGRLIEALGGSGQPNQIPQDP